MICSWACALFKCQYTGTCVQRSPSLAAHIPVTFVGIVPVPSALAHISHVQISSRSKWPHHVTASYWTPCGHPLCSHTLHTCHFSKPHWLPTTYDDLLLSMPALFNCNYTSTCIQHLHKSYRIWLHTFLIHLFKIAPVPLPLPTSHMSQHHSIPRDHISWGHLVRALSKHPPCCHILHTCQPSYSPQK